MHYFPGMAHDNNVNSKSAEDNNEYRMGRKKAPYKFAVHISGLTAAGGLTAGKGRGPGGSGRSGIPGDGTGNGDIRKSGWQIRHRAAGTAVNKRAGIK